MSAKRVTFTQAVMVKVSLLESRIVLQGVVSQEGLGTQIYNKSLT